MIQRSASWALLNTNGLLLSYQHEEAAEYFLLSLEGAPKCALAHAMVAACHSPNYNFNGEAYYETSFPPRSSYSCSRSSIHSCEEEDGCGDDQCDGQGCEICEDSENIASMSIASNSSFDQCPSPSPSQNPEDRLAAEDAGKFTDGGLSGSAPKGSAARASEAAAADTQIGPDTDKPVMDLTMEELEGINTGGWDGPLCWTKEL